MSSLSLWYSISESHIKFILGVYFLHHNLAMGLFSGAFRLLLIAPLAIGGDAAARNCSESGTAVRRVASLSMDWCGESNPEAEDLDSLSGAFVRAYDDVASSFESKHCFVIEDVEIDVEESYDRKLGVIDNPHGRRLDDEPINFDFGFFYLVNYQCFGCKDDGIYKNDGSRALEIEQSEAGDLRPTRSDFMQRYNEILSEEGLCVESLKGGSTVAVEVPNGSPSFGQLAAFVPCLLVAVLPSLDALL